MSPEHSIGGESPGDSQPKYRIVRYWKWELASLVLAIALLATMFVLVVQYDRQPTPDWKLPIGLSALLSLLATAFRVSILVPITSVISHSKWDWVGRDQVRFLSDIQDLDDASRGPLGAIRVIPLTAKGNIPALMAAMCSLLILATGPFIQQAMTTVTCDQAVAGLATVPYAHFTGSDEPDNRIEPICATGNCTFPAGDPTEGGGDVSHSTIALCHRCADTSSLLSRDNSPSLPNGARIGYIQDLAINSVVDSNLTWAGDTEAALDMVRLASTALVNVTTLIAGANETYTAGTCVLYTCLRSYRTSVREGQLIETELPSTPASPDLLKPFWYGGMATLAVVKSPCRAADNVIYSANNMSTAPNVTQLSLCETPAAARMPCQVRNISAPEACIYRQHGPFGEAMRSTLATAFAGNCTVYKGMACHGAFSSTSSWLIDLQKAMGNLTESGPMFQRIDDAFRAFAVSVSARYRRSFGGQSLGADALGSLLDGQKPGAAVGQAWQTMSCHSSRLAWLALPAGLAVVIAALLAWVVAGSWARRRVQPVWKESLLPLVLYKDRLLMEEEDTTGSTRVGGGGGRQEALMELAQITTWAGQVPRPSNYMLINETLMEVLVPKTAATSEDILNLPEDVKQRYLHDIPKSFLGFKPRGQAKIETNEPDRFEWFNLGQDSILGTETPTTQPIPPLVRTHLPPDAFTRLQLPTKPSGTVVRLIKAFAAERDEDVRTGMIHHTDFGTVTLLANVVGGLQVLAPGGSKEEPDRLAILARPERDASMRKLVDDDGLVGDAGDRDGEDEDLTAWEWEVKKAMALRRGDAVTESTGGEPRPLPA
ncbi:hypothetical protein PG984_004853 [Apiospora sp. TS-2023a]